MLLLRRSAIHPRRWPAGVGSVRGVTKTAMARTGSYTEAIGALNTLQSNAAIIEAIRKSGGKLNDFALPEMVEYLNRIGWQQTDLNRLNVVHITGTKGKGSTAAFVDSLVRHTALVDDSVREEPTVGLYTSPHLVQVRERIRLDGKPIDELLFTKYFWEVWNRLEQNPQRANPDLTPLRPVYFRFLTILAFHIFLTLKVRCTILEVGIGGKYDSTNIVPRPLVTGVSTLGLDHTALLGNTLEEIASQKAGIFKKGCPAITSYSESPGVLAVFEEEAKKAGSSDWKALPASSSTIRSARRGIPGEHQESNALLAVELYRSFMRSEEGRQHFKLDADDSDALSAVEKIGLENARWPGRCQVVKGAPQEHDRRWYLDGAHTAESLQACAAWFVKAGRSDVQKVLIFNTTHDRKSEELLRAMIASIAQQDGQKADRLYFDEVIFCTNTTYREGRSAGDLIAVAGEVSVEAQKTIQRAWQALDKNGSTRSHVCASIEEAIEQVQQVTCNVDGRTDVLVCGSLHLVGGAMSHLKDAGLLDESLNGVYQ